MAIRIMSGIRGIEEAEFAGKMRRIFFRTSKAFAPRFLGMKFLFGGS
jgi:hypothetical protein